MNSYNIDISKAIKANEWLLIELQEPIQDLTTVYTINFSVTPASATLTTEWRYSKDGDTWSEWRSWPAPNNSFNSEFTWLGFRVKADVNVMVTSVSLEWAGGELGENGTCACTITACGANSGDNSFLTNCNTSALYSTALSGINWFDNLTCSVFNNMGWPVLYFKADEIEESRDVIFKEWSLLKVRECKKIKVIVPDNDFGSGEFQFTEFDVDFADELEIQIHKESFWASFGAGEQPAEKDFLYFPLERRMYRLNSVQAHKGYMRQVNWWKATLVKWNESDSILKDADTQQAIDDLTLNFEDVGFEDIQATEEIDIVKPQQYTVRRISDSDNCRETINIDWEKSGVIERNLDNYYTVFSKFQYDLTFTPTPDPTGINEGGGIGATSAPGATALTEADPLITYQNSVNADSNFSAMFWYYMKPRVTGSLYEPGATVKLFGEQLPINVIGTETEFTGLELGTNTWTFNLPNNEWYAIYIGHNKDLNELTLRIWKRQDLANKTTKMEIVYESTIPPNLISGVWDISLYATGDEIASIRFLKDVMTVENQPIAFNKLIFREDSKGYIIDDCYPLSYLGMMSSR